MEPCTWRIGCSDLGVHVDGYVALVATTVVVSSGPVTGRAADAIMACKTASDVIIRMLQPGTYAMHAPLTDCTLRPADLESPRMGSLHSVSWAWRQDQRTALLWLSPFLVTKAGGPLAWE